MELGHEVGAVRLNARLRSVSPPVVRRLLVSEQSSLAEVHQILQVAFGWSDEHPYTFLIRGWRIGDPDRAAQLVRAGGRLDIPPAAFDFEIGEPFRYQYNASSGWEIDCRIEARTLLAATESAVCFAAWGDPPDEHLGGPAAYHEWFIDSDPAWAFYQVEELLDEDIGDEQFRREAREILANARLDAPRRREINERLRRLGTSGMHAGRQCEDAGPADHRR